MNEEKYKPVQVEDESIIKQEESVNEDKAIDGSEPNSDFVPVQLTQFFESNISTTEISLDASGNTKKERSEFLKGMGSAPFVYYNGVHIEYSDISNFELYHEGILPALKLVFKDRNGIFRDNGFPVDDTIVSIFIYSKSKRLRSIKMDFKVSKFRDIGDGSYSIVGICDIPRIFLKKFKSYSKKTSFEALQDIAKECDLGFCSNISNTSDKMTWINTGFPYHEYIQNIVSNSYSNDSAFMNCYIDYYYNLCYVDIEKELNRDNSNDMMVESSGGKSEFLDDEKTDEIIVPLMLSTDKSVKESSAYISNFSIINKSTQISINKSYLTRAKFYDTNQKEVLIFDVDSITSEGDKTIILKGKPNDEEYFKENVTSVWTGKLDKFEDDGSGNAHSNYNYAMVQNNINMDELIKVSIEIDLPTLNFNLYKMQKVYLALFKDMPGINQNSLRYKRIIGNWLIMSINILFDGRRQYQKITLIKRELELDPWEREQEKNKNSVGKEEYSDNENPISPNDTKPIDIPVNKNDPKNDTTTDPGYKTAYPEFRFSDQPSADEMLYGDAVTYLKSKYSDAISRAVFSVLYAEAAKNEKKTGFRSAGGHNFAGVQTDNARWGAPGIIGQFSRIDSGKVRRSFAIFKSNETFLDFMADRIKAKNFNGSDGDLWTDTYINKWWSPAAKKEYTKGTDKYNSKLAIYKTAMKKYDFIA